MKEQLVSATCTNFIRSKQECIDEIIYYSESYTKMNRYRKWLHRKEIMDKIEFWTQEIMRIERSKNNATN